MRRLRDAGAEVQVAMTEDAQRFVGAADLPGAVRPPGAHLAVGRRGRGRDGPYRTGALGRPDRDRARPPPTRSAKLAHGFADDLVSTLCLATTAPITVAPAMNHRMWLHPATQANIATLRARGVQVIGPDDGPLAEGESGPGRMSEPDAIVAALRRAGRAAR